eukprot:CAMPEP_0201152500 /NCGR_PEP_ID=MMETSP0851-20130426/13159_1 /ASSEMBLY_ACC=CAM_ASM_000631 /TAXON_ID=183588 /ORGANISM="Pseudo-nitzschia fraudulenta, Strain WWA7" /LENGTH=117 /DNA_ID=CAMNT_0047429521 /DNA_START=33 /DNA_END=389 /DNA_ORIENTATION=+
MKLRYGNVQRAVSQMRSGVPVLVDVRGRVLEDFVEKYNYTCVFRRDDRHNGNDNDNDYNNDYNNDYPSFEKAVEQLLRPEIRERCRKEGLRIAKDYAPSRIAQKFLRTVGFSGKFSC